MADLTVEEQEVVAWCKLSIEREQKLKEEARARFKANTEREQLLKEVREQVRERRDWKDVIIFVSIIAILGTVLFYSDDQSLKHFAFFAIVVLIMVKIHTDAIDRRFKALLELLDFDRQNHEGSHNSKDEKVG